MSRRARITLAGIPHHIIQRGNNRNPCFFSNEDYQTYLDWLEQYAEVCECKIHAYVLMTNHVHLLATPLAAGGLGQMMRRLGQRYVQYINRRYERTGGLWEGRFKSCITAEARYVLACYRYIELNPVRAAIANHPQDYRWSSYQVNAQGKASSLVSTSDIYNELGANFHNRRQAYRNLFENQLEAEVIDQIRSATKGNFAFGSERFCKDASKALGRRVIPAKLGRPKLKNCATSPIKNCAASPVYG